MKRILAVTLLLMSFASAAFADGPGLPPVKSTTSAALTDGPGLPPIKSTTSAAVRTM